MNALCNIRSINRTDAATLLNTFGSLNDIIKASYESIALCPGIGPYKARNVKNVLKQPFVKSIDKKTQNAQQKKITKFLKKS